MKENRNKYLLRQIFFAFHTPIAFTSRNLAHKKAKQELPTCQIRKYAQKFRKRILLPVISIQSNKGLSNLTQNNRL